MEKNELGQMGLFDDEIDLDEKKKKEKKRKRREKSIKTPFERTLAEDMDEDTDPLYLMQKSIQRSHNTYI